MSGEPLRYAVVGCSGIGRTHADGVRAADGVELVAGVDLDDAAAREFAATYDVVGTTDLTAAVEKLAIDAVSVCTPSGTHSSIVRECADLGLDVLCEKPLDVTAERVNGMIAACERADVTLSGIFQRRTHPGAQRARQAVTAGDLGSLVLATVDVRWHRSQEYYDSADWRGTREMDGGVLMNQAIHGIDMLGWLGGGVERVSADLDTLARDIEVPDTAVIDVRLGSGALGQIRATTAAHTDHPITLELTGERGSLRLQRDEIDAFETTDGPMAVDVDDRPEWGVGHTTQIQEFVDSLHEGREPMVPANEARRAVDVVLAAYESDERGEPVAVAEIREQ
ncbi:Gfo/Idh/MocA family protein [Halococcus agarilyticus]|uniref:Gfo/Idh/MocA family protein n=1 Tax=Halococcus agarilyticus TaxID=1232219 RepID=UPI000677E7D7|nr:Gfo/Idh/MocA family oxidoreductase [Halococcus agarilyticus]